MSQLTEMKTVLVTGYAKAPQGSSMYEIYKTSGIVMEIDTETNKIVNAEFTFVTDLAKDFLRRVIVNYDLTNGIEDLIKRIETHYYTPSTSSVVVAVKAAYKRYIEKTKHSE
ncbi:DUF3870 domain-containing protein [Bacillus sp. NEB1478]|uniref:DUF3870 domain-containing protein n=1 Tax=Bacillus sp. NEB1478 TaxID=3073816 RepID=UPI002873DE54|nr:DUF3870 domain-containing protein [Bacillus sp. NEB1478]WNB91073.1 DUF3870 domain-containing protein [Bacillus sp. NEB1478]